MDKKTKIVFTILLISLLGSISVFALTNRPSEKEEIPRETQIQKPSEKAPAAGETEEEMEEREKAFEVGQIQAS